MNEIWKPISGYEGYYEVSNTGKVRSVDRIIIDLNKKEIPLHGKELSLGMNNKGYYLVTLSKNNIHKTFLVHQLVAKTFIPNPDNFSIINHKDENPTNNNVENLEWCTQKYNVNYGTGKEKQILKVSKSIIMCDKKTHEPIKEFLNMKIATETLGYPISSKSSICEVLKGRRGSALGYWWKYKEK